MSPVCLAILEILDGIDKAETDRRNGGWWETSQGAEFGARKLKEIQAILENHNL